MHIREVFGEDLYARDLPFIEAVLAGDSQHSDRIMMDLGRAGPGSRSASLILISLDGFKPVNDLLGYGAGNEVLMEISERLQRTIRGTDMVARVGGDTFVVLA